MGTTPRSALRRELIGETIEVVGSTNKSLVGFKGKVVDETKNMIIIKNEKMKKIMKNQVTIKLNGNLIDGKLLVGRPEDRLKK